MPWLEELAAIDDAEERGRAVREHVLPDDAPAQVHGAVLAVLYSDLPRAARLVEVGKSIAHARVDPLAQAFAARCDAHLAYVRGQHEHALGAYADALRLFDQQDAQLESGRTLSSGLQTLILLGRYDQARQWAERAEAIFLKHGDALRLARLDSNVGNIFFRQDRPLDAILRYERALEGFQALGEPKDIAAAFSNLAVCHTSLAHFAQAFACYQRAREVSVANGLTHLVAQADYNVAYLHYLRGDYKQARELYESCRQNGDAYHCALSDLDEAELVLELNLTREGEALARRAERSFAARGMRYERAKSLVHVAIGASQRGDRKFADETLRDARALFEEECNRIWPAIVDLLRAVLAFHDGRFGAARILSLSAWRVLETAPMPSRAAHCQILLARLWLRAGQADRARAIGRAALERLGEDSSPSLRFHANFLEGEANEMQGRWQEAWNSYEAARREIEDLRTRVDTEDLRISILADKLAVYDALVSMCLDSPVGGPAERAMMLVQQAKSRTLADRLSSSFDSVEPLEQQPYAELRKELNWCYRQFERSALAGQSSDLRRRARSLEAELLHLKTEPSIGPRVNPGESVSSIQQSLPHATLLVEYFEARGTLYAFLLSRHGLESVRVGSSAPVRQMSRLLHFQLGKLQEPNIEATQHHLGELYRLLIAPFETHLARYSHLIIAPHRNLHGLPFSALHNGQEALIDRFTVSMTPSASVYAGCRTRLPTSNRGVVVMAVPDPRAPEIQEEANLVAQIFSGARLICGSDATLDAFRQNYAGLRVLHLAAHGIFRRDNPLFSSIQLADGRLNMLDLQHANLATDLVTLSACHSGSSVAVGGDELLGLVRGFLSAGARNVLVSLWEISDASTREFMRSFYSRLVSGASLPDAFRRAVIEVRWRYPHPYYWAPFILVGDSV